MEVADMAEGCGEEAAPQHRRARRRGLCGDLLLDEVKISGCLLCFDGSGGWLGQEGEGDGRRHAGIFAGVGSERGGGATVPACGKGGAP